MKARILFDYELGEYEKFLESCSDSPLQQSTAWFNFQNEYGRKCWRVVVEKEGKIVAAANLVKYVLPKGFCWIYCQGGPVGNYNNLDWLDSLLEEVKLLAKKERAIFWRISPLIEKYFRQQLEKMGFKLAHAHFQPESTLLIDLSLSEDEILTQMKPKGRYNTKVAQKNGVRVRFSDGKNGDLEKFYKLMQKTTTRNGFRGHDFEYYRLMLKNLFPGRQAVLALAEHDDDVLAAAILTFFNKTGTYYYGASGNTKRNLMAPYLLQWEMIKESKKRGYSRYDFLGISPLEAGENHPWATVTDFKLKFGGERKDYLPEMEIILKPLLYYLLLMLKTLKKFLKR